MNVATIILCVITLSLLPLKVNATLCLYVGKLTAYLRVRLLGVTVMTEKITFNGQIQLDGTIDGQLQLQGNSGAGNLLVIDQVDVTNVINIANANSYKYYVCSEVISTVVGTVAHKLLPQRINIRTLVGTQGIISVNVNANTNLVKIITATIGGTK